MYIKKCMLKLIYMYMCTYMYMYDVHVYMEYFIYTRTG